MNLQLQTLLATMLEGIEQGNEYFINLLQYYREGKPVWTTAITMSNHHMSDIALGETGFDCSVYFQPAYLKPDKTKIHIKYEDIWGIYQIHSPIIDTNSQTPLYRNDEVLKRYKI